MSILLKIKKVIICAKILINVNSNVNSKGFVQLNMKKQEQYGRVILTNLNITLISKLILANSLVKFKSLKTALNTKKYTNASQTNTDAQLDAQNAKHSA